MGEDLHCALPAGLKDLVVNFAPGVIGGLVLGWEMVPSLLLGGVVYISSSGIIAKVLTDLDRLENGETPVIMSILVLEDIAMAAYLPLMSILVIGQGRLSGLGSIAIGGVVGGALLFVALHYSKPVSSLIAHHSNEVVLLSALGLTLLVAGFFAAIFFLFFGLSIDPTTLVPVLIPAAILALFTAAAKVFTGWWATQGMDLDIGSRLRAGITLIARGEFSLVIAMMGISAGLDPRLGTLSAAYVLFTAVLGPLALRVAEPALRQMTKKIPQRQPRERESIATRLTHP